VDGFPSTSLVSWQRFVRHKIGGNEMWWEPQRKEHLSCKAEADGTSQKEEQ